MKLLPSLLKKKNCEILSFWNSLFSQGMFSNITTIYNINHQTRYKRAGILVGNPLATSSVADIYTPDPMIQHI